MNSVETYSDILPQENYYSLIKTINKLEWQFGGSSIPNTGIRFWYCNLIKNQFFLDWLPKIEELAGKKFKIEKLYANGQTFGQDGDWHYDSQIEGGWTFLYYYNDIDDLSLVGETYLMLDGLPLAITPHPNSAIMFDHTVLHKGMGPKRNYTDLRVTIAFKLIEI